MQQLNDFIIITGALTSGKSTLCHDLSGALRKFWNIAGILSFTSKRNFASKEKSLEYSIYSIHNKETLAWAKRNSSNERFVFLEENAQTLSAKILAHHTTSPCDVIILDNLGFHEMKQQGFYKLLTQIDSNKTQMIISVQKDMLKEFLNFFNFSNFVLIDLDEIPRAQALLQIINLLKQRDAHLIGTFASITTIMELGLGTSLNAFRVPLKGIFLAGLQNFMLILFGKKLKGRGLLSIVTITAGLKSFSLAGSKFRPMFYIFFQGLFFTIPIYLLGQNFLSVLLGSIFLCISTFFLGVILNSVIFGMSYVYANINAVNEILNYFHFNSLSIINVVVLILLFKTLIAFVITLTAYYMNFDFLILKLSNQVNTIIPPSHALTYPKSDWKTSFKGSLGDLLNLKFITSLIFFSLIIYFFARLDTNDFILVIIRAIIISWFGFILARKIDFATIVGFLNRRNYLYLAHALEKALSIVHSFKNNKTKIF
ncbi:MAG: hypothetical protein A2381_16990 [Bdellovibrionales bacterium RIFOXYB1_FULL_37_110]|nr:MAG: hypothetical protein A2417_18825 [Bdellovibrionales bacterium RIFOXYC1_FULL_37_79]OFZ59999.1 MAG: hypothetical protein A2381_16990 [Bdellovibrionales bacterium RIFOXYB1_FULL_37_110]OFZ64278.1 MAG: hypothetical protein A2577_12665 [Bdellovibrionales bacterium RIFOXYD1_FULL_36_51]